MLTHFDTKNSDGSGTHEINATVDATRSAEHLIKIAFLKSQ